MPEVHPVASNDAPSMEHSKWSVVAGSLLVKLNAIDVKPVVSPLLMEVPLLSGTLAVSDAMVGAVRSTVHVKTEEGTPMFP
jgi:hypothetical protein